MSLVDAVTRRSLPELYACENQKDPVAKVKLFTPWTGWTWYAIEWDGEDMCFGYVVGDERELGYFSLKELEDIRGPGGIKIEVDLYFHPTPLSLLKQGREASPPHRGAARSR